TRTVTLDERPPSRYRDVVLVNGGRDSRSGTVPADDDDDWGASYVPTPSDEATADMEVDETGEQATNMEVEPASHTVVSLTGGCSALQSNGSMRSSETSEVDLRADRHSGLLPSIAEPNQAPRLPASSSSSRAIGGSEPARDLLFSENRIVFSGGSRPGRSARSDQTRLLTNGDVDREENEVGEPDPKRPRLDEYEIALAATDVPGILTV
ncbi:hypothetical protein PF005_g27493, partial [Phytophthora fragariae]